MIDARSVKKYLLSIKGIIIDSVKENTNNIIVYFYFDAIISINGANFTLDNKIQLEIPKNYPINLPVVFEFGEKKIKNFPHVNPDIRGTFCLGTEIDIRRQLNPNYSLIKYISLIADFLGTYKYYAEYKVFPYGDRSHGESGIFESYKEIFSVDTNQKVLNLMSINSLKNKYRNKNCPCASGIKFKKCHWNVLNRIFRNPLEYSQMKKDYLNLKG